MNVIKTKTENNQFKVVLKVLKHTSHNQELCSVNVMIETHTKKQNAITK